MVKFQLHGGRGQEEAFVLCTKESLIYKDTSLKMMRSQQDENNNHNNTEENSTDNTNNPFLGF